MIKLQNITKKYGEKVAVDDLSLEIKEGEVVGLLGPNGAGKSTTMKIITGYLVPDNGEVLIDENNINDNIIYAKSKIGYMPENNPLYKDMLVDEAVNLAMELHNVPLEKRKERVDYVVKSTGIQGVFYRPISELSKGYKQRVGLAQVLVHDPQILILDEPTEGLDPNQRAEIRNLIRELGKDRTVIISTHVMQEVEAMCNRIVIINKGNIVLDDNKETINKRKDADNEILIRIKTTSGKVKLGDLKDLEVETIEDLKDEKNISKFRITTKNPERFYSEFTSLIKSKDWVLYELNTKQHNLEDLFRELTKE